MNIWHRFLLLVCVFRSLKLMNVKAFLLPVCVLVFVSSHAMADQNADELPDLFTQLKNETSSEASTAIEHQIWRHWLQAPNRNSASLLSQVTQAMSLGRLDIALTLSNQLVDSAPEFAEAWNKRATIYFLLGQDTNSVADIRETVKLEPNHFGAISGLGMIFMRSRNYQAALEAFEQVLEISPASVNARRSVENARRRLGDEV